jgi:hypothetical protein
MKKIKYSKKAQAELNRRRELRDLLFKLYFKNYAKRLLQ